MDVEQRAILSLLTSGRCVAEPAGAALPFAADCRLIARHVGAYQACPARQGAAQIGHVAVANVLRKSIALTLPETHPAEIIVALGREGKKEPGIDPEKRPTSAARQKHQGCDDPPSEPASHLMMARRNSSHMETVKLAGGLRCRFFLRWRRAGMSLRQPVATTGASFGAAARTRLRPSSLAWYRAWSAASTSSSGWLLS